MQKLFLVALGCATAGLASAEPASELVFQLKSSVVKVHTVTKTGGHGVGTGVVVAPDHVATNCHVLANASGVTIRKMGENFAPVGLKADWKHDVCVLRFQNLPLSPVPLGDSGSLQYEQPVFTVGFPGGVPKPQLTTGKIKALYPLDDSVIVRTSASFRIGASGSPVMDEAGRLIALNTFKSPGRDAYFYNVPVKWIQALLNAQESTAVQQQDLPFWDAPEEVRPYFMRIVPALQEERWQELTRIATQWTEAEPANAEAWYTLGLSALRSGAEPLATQHFQRALALQPQHPAALYEMGLLASRAGQRGEFQRILVALNGIDRELAQALEQSEPQRQ